MEAVPDLARLEVLLNQEEAQVAQDTDQDNHHHLIKEALTNKEEVVAQEAHQEDFTAKEAQVKVLNQSIIHHKEAQEDHHHSVAVAVDLVDLLSDLAVEVAEVDLHLVAANLQAEAEGLMEAIHNNLDLLMDQQFITKWLPEDIQVKEVKEVEALALEAHQQDLEVAHMEALVEVDRHLDNQILPVTLHPTVVEVAHLMEVPHLQEADIKSEWRKSQNSKPYIP